MNIYKISIGWLIQYNFHTPDSFICIRKDAPYLASAISYVGNPEFLRDKLVEYHTLPEHIKISLAAAQSTLSELEYMKSAKLEAMLQKIKGDQNGDY